MTGPERPELCVGAVVVRRDELLLVQRGRGAAVGRWSVPGGRVEVGETLTQAVVREVGEETGLVVICGEPLGWVERIDDLHHFVICDFRATPADPDQAPRAGDDAAAVAWVPLAEVRSLDLVDGLADFLASHGILPLNP